MQVNDQHDDLDNLPSFSLSDEERTSRMGSHIKDAASSKAKAHALVTEKQRSSYKLVVFLIIVIVALIAGGAWQLDMLHNKLQQAQAQMTQMTAQMDQISGTLTSSGQTASKATEQLGHQLKSITQEQQSMNKKINSLQSVADDNKKDIANLRWRNKLDSAKQAKDTKQLETHDKQLTSLNNQIKNLSTNQLSSTASWEAQFDQLKKQTDDLAQSAKQDNIALLNKKLASYESALKSMDDYRLQINRRLLQLENSVRNLQNKGQ